MSVLVLTLALGPMSARADNPPVTVSVDANANRRSISPLVYGVHFASSANLLDLNATLNRYGGNSAGRYNWQQNVDNRGGDWYFESAPYENVAGRYMDDFIQASKDGAAEAFLTLPMVGSVARTNAGRNVLYSFPVDQCGPQTDTRPGNANAGNGCSPGGGIYPCDSSGGTAMRTPPAGCNASTNASVAASEAFQQGWVQHVRNTWGAASAGGLKFWGYDNEPSIWHNVYWDVHPQGASAAEMIAKTKAYGSMVKTVDPTVQTLGPEEWGWDGYFWSGADQLAWFNGECAGFDCPDYAAHGPYSAYYIAKMKEHHDTTGVRILDYFTQHIYPQGGEFSSDVSQAMQLRRNRSTRALWDVDYVDDSWINAEVKLIPRMKDWAAAYPGTKIGITEYNWGAPEHINGAIAHADVMGIMGREGVDMAIWWITGPPPVGTPAYNAFKMYRNYDGAKSTFGDTSVSATVPNPDQLAAFAAERTSDGRLAIMVINKVLTENTPTTINLANFASNGPAQVFQLTSANAITPLASAPVVANQISLSLPPQSITLLVVPPSGGGGTTADLSITKSDGQDTTFPGQSLIYTIVAANAGPGTVTGATVFDDVPTSLVGAVWTCTGANGGTCGAANGNGDINTTVGLPSGASATFFLQATVAASPGPVRNIATITAPGGVTDPNPGNNSATDDDFLACDAYTVIVPDGRRTTGNLLPGDTAWFVSSLRLGSSYSAEFRNELESTVPATLTVFSGDDGCTGTSTVDAHDTAAIDPPANGIRRSFTAAGDDPMYRLKLVNAGVAPLPYAFRVVETSQFSPAWSTFGTYNTYYSLQNTTRITVSAILTLRDTTGAVVGTGALTIPPGETASTNTVALGVTRDRTGTAVFVHDAPPGAIVAAAAIANFTFSRPYIQPVKFEAVRDSR